MRHVTRPVRGFTLIELLVVISIIAVLAAMGLATATLIKRNALRDRTARIMQIAHQALALGRADRGGIAAPGAHPLAGTQAPRLQFVRKAGGALVDRVQEWPYLGVPAGLLPAAGESRLLLADDVFADTASPMLFGMPRARLTVLGAALPEVTGHLQVTSRDGRRPQVATLVKPGHQNDGTTVTADPAATVDPGALRPDPSGGADFTLPERRVVLMRQFMAQALGTVDAIPELTRLQGLWAPPDDVDAHLILDRRLWSPVAAGVADPKDGSTVAIAGSPQRYRLRGPALYDAWGREILCSVDDSGNLRLESAGRDGFFRIDPRDGGFQTAADADAIAAGDGDGAQDNVREGAQ